MGYDTLENDTVLRDRAIRFKASCLIDNPFHGCIRALGGIAIPIEKPRNVSNPPVVKSGNRL